MRFNHEAGRKLSTLEVGRGMAALLVVLFHTTDILSTRKNYGEELFGGIFRIGHIGVDFFFVLSGFIILHVHRNEIGKAGSVSAYLRKRMIRIYPVYWIVTMLVVLISLITSGMSVPLLYLIKSLLLIPQQQLPVVGVGWTLIYEMFFYLLFALLMFRPRVGLAVMGLLITAVVSVQLGGIKPKEMHLSAGFSFLFNRQLLEFFMGMATAELVRHSAQLRFPGTAMVIIILGFLLLITINGTGYHYQLGFAFCFALLIYLFVMLERERGLSVPAWAAYLGAASYSLYLVHYFVLSAVLKCIVAIRDKLGYAIPLDMAAIVLVVSAITAGLLFYAFVEKPLLQRLRRQYSH